MPEEKDYIGPLHLKDYLVDCSEELAEAIRNSVSHTVSTIRSISCPCKSDSLRQTIDEQARSEDPDKRKTASDRLEKLKKHHKERMSSGSSARLLAIREGDTAIIRKSMLPCRMFAVETNEEEGIVRGFCRRCQKLFPIFDRALYWGVRRSSPNPPESWPYRCVCGGHSFEVGIGFDYDEDPMDENDFHTVTIGIRCCACDSIHMIMDDEA